MLKVEHIMVVGHYGCGGVRPPCTAQRIGLADNWIRHIQDVRDRHRGILENMAPSSRRQWLVDLNVIEQVVNLSVSTVMVDAWAKGQNVTVHGWASAWTTACCRTWQHDGRQHRRDRARLPRRRGRIAARS